MGDGGRGGIGGARAGVQEKGVEACWRGDGVVVWRGEVLTKGGLSRDCRREIARVVFMFCVLA